jgi:hypothetical protein
VTLRENRAGNRESTIARKPIKKKQQKEVLENK